MTQNPAQSCNLLVADASPQMASLVAAMLRQLNYRHISEASTSVDFLAMVELRQFQVSLVADDLEPMDGVQVTRRLRELRENVNHDAVVIMMATAPSAARITEARDAGVTEFLRKPFSIQVLGQRLDAALKSPRDFVESQSYQGPDRRRRSGNYTGPDRRGSSTD